mgnify:FL=1
MEEKAKKNNWTQSKVENASKKINQEIYNRNRQAPIQIKLDDLSIFVNGRITRRGIAKGMVFIQEDFNKNILDIEKRTIEILLNLNLNEQYEELQKIKHIMKIEIWSDIRFLMINKAITPGEITELIRIQIEIDKDIEKWGESIKKAISAGR